MTVIFGQILNNMYSLFENCLAPRFATLTPSSTQVDAISKLTDGLNEWFAWYFTGVRCNIYGTVTFPSGATTTLGTPATPLKICMPITELFNLVLSEMLLAVSVPSGGLVNLFSYIGSKITGTLTTWTAAPTILGVMPGVLETSHFGMIAEDMMLELSSINPDPEVTPNATEEIWNIIEKRLTSALKMIIPTPIPFTGAFGPGIFVGTALICLDREGI